jgi:hypothetical protein
METVMTAISNLRTTENNPANSAVTAPESPETSKTDGQDFEALLRGMVSPDGANQVNEEELFAGIIFERLKSTKGEEVANKYATSLASEKAALQKSSGYVPVEDAAKNALKSLRADGSLSSEEADTVYSEAFDAAQLDANKNALYDGRGSAGDSTIALALMESALASSKMLVEKFSSGETQATARSLDGNGELTPLGAPIASGDGSTVPLSNLPTGTVFDGADGFLFKPESSTDKKLAILLPEALAHQVLSVVVKDENDNTLEEGRSTGYGELGTREKFAFTKSGQEYGKNVTVHAILADGSERQWSIPDASQRYD